jgi:hypothetical protein
VGRLFGVVDVGVVEVKDEGADGLKEGGEGGRYGLVWFRTSVGHFEEKFEVSGWGFEISPFYDLALFYTSLRISSYLCSRSACI